MAPTQVDAVNLPRGPMPRDLHPAAWWVWALGLATFASFTTNPVLLLAVVATATVVVLARRSDQPWSRSFRLYVALGAVIVVVRVVFRVLLGGAYGETVLLDLPTLPLPGWVRGVSILGPITRESVLAGLYDGMRLAAIVVCVGAANALANPKRLLRSVPPALYEIGTALVVAVSVLPQFADSVRRVRAAQSLRAGEVGRVRGLRRTVVPVLEDALSRSLSLAAGMDARGYGRAGGATRTQRRTTGALMLAGLVGVCVGTYSLLDQTAPRYLALPMLGAGSVVAVAGVANAGRRVVRTRYRPDPWSVPETAVAVAGIAAGAIGWWVSSHQLAIAYPPLSVVPTVSATALVGSLLGLGAAACAPAPQLRARTVPA